jgi:membrane-bound lytic murein transglycosylase D
MQLLTNISKYLILALLTCSFLIVWRDGSIPEIGRYSATEEVSSKPIESVWDSLSRELNLDHKAQSVQVKAEIRKLLADQDKFYQILDQAGPYIYYIYKQVQARGLPAELALIPVIESEFNPYDRSKKGATGLWQLMPGTASELGVKVKNGYDGRRNVIASTKAALAYFNDLGNMFNGDWYLALAAYNSGQGRVMSEVRKAGSNNFWNLNRLPKETRYYVPKLLAVAAIMKNPEKYGIELPTVDNKPYFTEIQVKKVPNLEKVAKSSGMSVKTLTWLNPDYKKGPVPKKNNTYSFLVPVDKVPAVKVELSDSVVKIASPIPASTKTSIKS